MLLAAGAPRRPLIRPSYTPNALGVWDCHGAANCRAVAARWAVGSLYKRYRFQPAILVPGQDPLQEGICFTLDQPVLMARPTSQMTSNAVGASIPPVRVRSTPIIAYICTRTSKAGVWPWR